MEGWESRGHHRFGTCVATGLQEVWHWLDRRILVMGPPTRLWTFDALPPMEAGAREDRCEAWGCEGWEGPGPQSKGHYAYMILQQGIYMLWSK